MRQGGNATTRRSGKGNEPTAPKHECFDSDGDRTDNDHDHGDRDGNDNGDHHDLDDRYDNRDDNHADHDDAHHDETTTTTATTTAAATTINTTTAATTTTTTTTTTTIISFAHVFKPHTRAMIGPHPNPEPCHFAAARLRRTRPAFIAATFVVER